MLFYFRAKIDGKRLVNSEEGEGSNAKKSYVKIFIYDLLSLSTGQSMPFLPLLLIGD
jgi:hypothetical protein